MTTSWRYRFARALSPGLLACLSCLAATLPAGASQWSAATVDVSTSTVGSFTSLALDANDKAHISYLSGSAGLKYATNKTGSWVTRSLASSSIVAAGTAIAVDSDNLPQVTYYRSNGVRNTWFNGSSWQSAVNIHSGTFTPTSGTAVSTVNKDGYTYASYYAGRLYYSRNNTQNSYTGSWTSQAIDSTGGVGTYSALAVDATGVVHAVYYNANTSKLLYKKRTTAGSWDTNPTQVVSGTDDVGRYCSLALGTVGSSETLHATYLDNTTKNLMYTTKSLPGGAWSTPVVLGAVGSNGGSSSIKVDSTGAAHVAYYYSTGSTNGKLVYASNLGGSWLSEDVDTSSRVGSYPSLAIAGDQSVTVAHYDALNTNPKVASRAALLVSAPLNFGTVNRGFQSAAGTLTVTNNLLVDQQVGSLTTGGSDPTAFSQASNGCSGLLLAPQGSCTATYSFAPPVSDQRSSAKSAQVTVAASFPYALSQTVALSGSTSANYVVTASAGNGGTISPTLAAVAPGGSQVFSVSVTPGFSLTSVTADGGTTLASPYTLTNVSADHTVFAALVSPIRLLENAIFYGSLQSAYGAANDGWTVQSQQSIPVGDLVVDRADVSVTISGGYDSSFGSQTGMTQLPGNISISDGTLAVENLQLQ